MKYKIGFEGRKTKRIGEHDGVYDIDDARRELHFYKKTYGSKFEFWIAPAEPKTVINESLRVK